MGVGVDVCALARIEEVWRAHGDRFENRILTPEERAARAWDAPALARRWAMKEAVAKALGTGIGAMVGFRDIQVTHDAAGAPLVTVRGREDLRVFASVSDDSVAGAAVAYCVVCAADN